MHKDFTESSQRLFGMKVIEVNLPEFKDEILLYSPTTESLFANVAILLEMQSLMSTKLESMIGK